MSRRAALGTALIGATLSASPFSACAIVERSVEPREGGTDASATGPANGGMDGSGGNASGGKASGGSTGDAAPRDSAADAADGAPVATGGVTSTGGAGSGGAGSGGGPVRRDAGTDSCRHLTGLGDVMLCDDFEQPALSSQWRSFTSDGDEGSTHLVPDPFPRRGERSLISTKSAPGPRNPLVADVLAGMTGGHLYLRAWMHFPSSATLSNHPLANATLFVLGEDRGPAYRGCSVALWQGRLTTQCNGVQAGSYAAPADTLPLDRWVCVRHDFPIGDAIPASEFRVRVGETTLPNAVTTPTTTTLDTGYTRVWLGLNHISESQATTMVVYYDDVVVDTKDIACE